MTGSLKAWLRRYAYVLALPLLAWQPAVLAAQLPDMTPRGAAMGGIGAYDAVACGQEASRFNPAALARPCDELSLQAFFPPNAALFALANAPFWEVRRDIMEGFGTQSELLAKIPPEGLISRLGLDVGLLALGSRSLSVAASYSLRLQGQWSRELLALYLEGPTPDSPLPPGTSTHEAQAWITLALAHGRNLGLVDVGVTGNLILGVGLLKLGTTPPLIDETNGTVSMDAWGVAAGNGFPVTSAELFDLRPPDGYGLSLDLGVRRDLLLVPVTLSLVLENAVQVMSWKDQRRLYTVRVASDGQEFTWEANDEMLADAENPPAEAVQVAETLEEDASFPRRIRASASYDAGIAQVSAGIATVAGGGQIDREWDQRLSIGAELRPLPYVAVRAGAAVTASDADLNGNRRELNGGLGFGFGGVGLDLMAGLLDTAGSELDGWHGGLRFVIRTGR